MSRQKLTSTGRSEAWIEILTGVENALEITLNEVARREQALSARPATDRSDTSSRLARCSERWQGLWLRSADGEKELSNAEAVLATAEESLRKHLDGLDACRQNLAQWLGRAVG